MNIHHLYEDVLLYITCLLDINSLYHFTQINHFTLKLYQSKIFWVNYFMKNNLKIITYQTSIKSWVNEYKTNLIINLPIKSYQTFIGLTDCHFIYIYLNQPIYIKTLSSICQYDFIKSLLDINLLGLPIERKNDMISQWVIKLRI